MVIDTSAICTVLFNEAERDAMANAIVADAVRLLSAPTVFEASIVLLARKGAPGLRELDLLLHGIAASVVPFGPDHALLARNAYARFGKGRHPAGLNFGDCCSYALARSSGEPLLFKGADFSQTDLAAVPW